MINDKFTSSSPEETQKIGLDIAKKLKGGDIVFLSGILGAGKTELIRGIAKGLGIKNKITSPTFNILRVYPIPIGGELYHFDCYRLKKYADLVELGWEEIINDKNVIVILEWPECILDKDIRRIRGINRFWSKIKVEGTKRVVIIKTKNQKIKN